ncbi:sigma-70 family RNA polymerase sigma factor [Clostridium botulinum]|uniref:RNA polymerase sigma-F factor n=1 Tax=Clostridium botulinum (strain Eklund 17B / Type B) TaxID=935198 RepID=B2THE9_CLOBB|nr:MULTISPECIES: sigma-70 family RNA polymerase sigma factor [Clostridium]ACD24853.1 RNA polymerase sigma-F factor [Clostridium botulinum B str. Eklund 17B (NRP)]MBY6977416.1 sigma-70 family RNA polymerase sigma factor [Clostridium botulinum]MBY7001971.1 sigma-70 family RNA polymerase sigma factor [Clostridium botulinum]MCR1275582.1 sigma-70 family RNA polymerase sigma factor [Clostridium botulinum]MCS6131407.1 sigma-70 family RNA polymerase sigma factor [Clostridium botulinum]
MSNEELVELYQEGDKQALNKLIENNKKLVFKIVNKFYINATNSIDIEDLEQEGYMGLIMAAKKYNSNMDYHASFSTYSFYWIYQKINSFIKQKNTNDETSLNIPLNEGEEKEKVDLIEYIDNGYENIEEKLYLEQLRSDLENLMEHNTTLRERSILKLHYGWDCRECTMTYIAGMLEISQQRVRQIEKSTLRKLRRTKWIKCEYEKYYGSIKKNYINIEKKIDFTNKYFKGVI